jgi:hypothetical protein
MCGQSNDCLLPLRDSKPIAGPDVVAVNLAVNNTRNQGPELLQTTHGVLPL